MGILPTRVSGRHIHMLGAHGGQKRDLCFFLNNQEMGKNHSPPKGKASEKQLYHAAFRGL